MKRFFVFLAGLAISIAGFALMYHMMVVTINNDTGLVASFALVLGVPLLVLVPGLALLFWSCSDNFYDVSSGIVLEHCFTPAHMTPPIWVPGTPAMGTTPDTPGTMIPGHWEEDDWAIQIKDANGHTGWLHFKDNTFEKYPVGSHYGEL